jgi:hypothetical protein
MSELLSPPDDRPRFLPAAMNLLVKVSACEKALGIGRRTPRPISKQLLDVFPWEFDS